MATKKESVNGAKKRTVKARSGEPPPTTTNASSPAARERVIDRPTYRPDQLLVTITSDVVRKSSATRAHAAAIEGTVMSPFMALEAAGLIEDVTAIAIPTARPAASRAAKAIADSLDPAIDEAVAGVNLVRVAAGSSLDEVRRQLAGARGVEKVERVPFRTIGLPNRPRLAQGRRRPSAPTWNLREVAWTGRTPPDAREIRVAVLDSGVDPEHPDLEIAAYEVGGVSEEDIEGHGTHVCGIIAGAVSTSRVFHAGICNTRLLVWKVFSDRPDPDYGYVVDEVLYQRALLAALRSDCKIMNLSIGGEATTSSERRLIKRLVGGGMTLVAAMGNEYTSGNPTEYPAALPDVIAVGAVGRDLRRATFSNTGDHITLVAPGVEIPSTLPRTSSVARQETDYAEWDGTSMAAPHVTAAAIRLLCDDPDLSPAQVKKALEAGAKKLPGMQGRDWTRGYGAGLVQL